MSGRRARHVPGKDFQFTWEAAVMEAMFRAQATGRRYKVCRSDFVLRRWMVQEVGA